MRMHHIRPDLTQPLHQPPIRQIILPRQYRPPHLLKNFHPISPLQRPLQKRPLRPNRRPRNQSHLMPQPMLPLTRQNRILLRPPHNQPRNHMHNPPPPNPIPSRATPIGATPKPASRRRRRSGEGYVSPFTSKRTPPLPGPSGWDATG